MNRHHEGDHAGYRRIRATMALSEILELVTSFEKAAFDFYASLIPRVGAQTRLLVEELAGEERHHYELFRALANHPRLHEQIRDRIETTIEHNGFTAHLTRNELEDSPDDRAILGYALAREKVAMNQYLELAANTAPGPARDLFRFLASEETRHKQELQRLYLQLAYAPPPGDTAPRPGLWPHRIA